MTRHSSPPAKFRPNAATITTGSLPLSLRRDSDSALGESLSCVDLEPDDPQHYPKELSFPESDKSSEATLRPEAIGTRWAYGETNRMRTIRKMGPAAAREPQHHWCKRWRPAQRRELERTNQAARSQRRGIGEGSRLSVSIARERRRRETLAPTLTHRRVTVEGIETQHFRRLDDGGRKLPAVYLLGRSRSNLSVLGGRETLTTLVFPAFTSRLLHAENEDSLMRIFASRVTRGSWICITLGRLIRAEVCPSSRNTATWSGSCPSSGRNCLMTCHC